MRKWLGNCTKRSRVHFSHFWVARDTQSTELCLHAWVRWALWPATLSFQQRAVSPRKYLIRRNTKHHLAMIMVDRLHELHTNLTWVWSTLLLVPPWFQRLPEKCECLLVRQSSSSTPHQHNPTVKTVDTTLTSLGDSISGNVTSCSSLHHLCNCWWHRSIACSLLLPQALQKYLDQHDSRGKPA